LPRLNLKDKARKQLRYFSNSYRHYAALIIRTLHKVGLQLQNPTFSVMHRRDPCSKYFKPPVGAKVMFTLQGLFFYTDTLEEDISTTACEVERQTRIRGRRVFRAVLNIPNIKFSNKKLFLNYCLSYPQAPSGIRTTDILIKNEQYH